MKTRANLNAIARHLQKAIDEWTNFDNPDADISGADLVEWFEQFRREAKALLANH